MAELVNAPWDDRLLMLLYDHLIVWFTVYILFNRFFYTRRAETWMYV